MNLALLGSLLVAGLLGSGHCVAMCSGISTTLSAPLAARGVSPLWLQLGRMLGYGTLGALAAGIGTGMFEAMKLASVVRPVWIIANVLAIVTGFTLLIHARQPRWLDQFGYRFAQAAGLHSPASAAGPSVITVVPAGARAAMPAPVSRLRVVALGATWALLPCGFLYSALMLVMVSANALSGALAMAGFAAATAVPLMLAQRWASVAGGATGARSRSLLGARLLGAVMIAASAYGIVMIASGAADRLFCR